MAVPPNMLGERVLCRLYLLTTDLVHTLPAYERAVSLARKSGLAGATVLRGILGFGSRGIVEPSLWHISNPTPVIVEVVDASAAILGYVRELAPLLVHGLITLERAGMVMYRHRTEPAGGAGALALLGAVPELSTVPVFDGSSQMDTQLAMRDGMLLRIFAGDSDTYGGKPLHEAVVRKARELGLAGATVLRGSMGFGAHSVVQTTSMLELSTDLPIVIEIADIEEKIRAFLPHLETMIVEGMITMEAVRMVQYAGGAKDT